jgi:hypothetical protein
VTARTCVVPAGPDAPLACSFLLSARPSKNDGLGIATDKVRETPSWPRSWANLRLLWLYYHRNTRANCIFWANLTPFSLKVFTAVTADGGRSFAFGGWLIPLADPYRAVGLGLGRTVASHHRSPASYQIR